jgi:hypothetical protein
LVQEAGPNVQAREEQLRGMRGVLGQQKDSVSGGGLPHQ